MNKYDQLDYLQLLGVTNWRLRKPNYDQRANMLKNEKTVQIKEEENPNANLSWEELKAGVDVCKRCELYKTRTHAVFGVGNKAADLMVIGEAPGANEDRQGEPFVGRAGRLLNSMLKAIGLAREDVYIANVLKSRPPNNRDPTPEEVSACIPYLHRQIALVQPRLLLVVGRIAAQHLLATNLSMGQLRGQEFYYGSQKIPIIVTYHPAYLLRAPREKRKAWEDMKRVVNFFSNSNKKK